MDINQATQIPRLHYSIMICAEWVVNEVQNVHNFQLWNLLCTRATNSTVTLLSHCAHYWVTVLVIEATTVSLHSSLRPLLYHCTRYWGHYCIIALVIEAIAVSLYSLLRPLLHHCTRHWSHYCIIALVIEAIAVSLYSLLRPLLHHCTRYWGHSYIIALVIEAITVSNV